MATIDPKKLLPSSDQSKNREKFLVPASSVIVKKSVSFSPKLLKPVDKKVEKVETTSSVDLVGKLIKVEDILKRNLALQIKEEKNKDQDNERKERDEKEKKLELKEKNNLKLPQISLPKVGIIDAIKNFLLNTIVGFFAVKLFEMAPQISKLLEYTKPVLKFIGYFSENLANSVIDFIDTGYKTYDSLDNTIKELGGDKAAKTFEDFSSQFNKLLNGAIIASMLIISTKPPLPKPKIGFDRFGRRVGQEAQEKYLEKFGERKFLERFGKKNLTRLVANRAAAQAAEGGAKSLASQGLKQTLKGATRFAAVPVIGGLISFIIDTVIFREKPSRAAAGAVGNTVGTGIGIALAGSTTFGLGAGVGAFIGGFLGDIIGKSLYDAFAGKREEPIEARAEGGQVTRGGKRVGGAVTRTLRKPKKAIVKPRPQPTLPGKDVGGLKNIEKLYGKDEPNKKSALRVLKRSSEIVKRSQIPFLGNILGIGIDMTMGQRPEMSAIRQIGNALGQFVQNVIDSEISGSFNEIVRSIFGMAEGGVVPRGLPQENNIGYKVANAINTLFVSTLSSKVNTIMSNILQELQLKGEPPGGAIPSGDSGGAPGDFSGDARAMQAFNYFKSQGYSDFQAAAIVGNLLQENRAMNPSLVNSIGATGIAQWRLDRLDELKAFAKRKSTSPYDFKTQLEFIQYELKTGKGGLSERNFKSTKNIEEATVLFRKQYERPGEAEANDTQRIKNAKGVLQSSSFEYVAPGKVMPVVTGRYGESRKTGSHGGSDLAVPEGTPLRAISDGKIIESNIDPGGWGNFTVFTDKKGIYHLYGHMKGKGRSAGNIKKGDIIGYVGMTGRTSGPHLHWEAGTGWNGTIQGKFDPLKRYSVNAPFNTQKDEVKVKPDKNTPASIFNWQQSAAPTPTKSPDSQQVASLTPSSTKSQSSTVASLSNYSQASGDAPSSTIAIQRIYVLST